MLSLKEQLLKIINDLSGNVFTLGIVDQDLIVAIQSNIKINHFLMLNINQKVTYESSSNYKPIKNVKISKISKKNKKKKIDYSICEISDCKEHLGTFINDTIYFNKNKIYFYGKTNEYDLDILIKKYRRYNVVTTLYKFSFNEFILEIDTSKAKTNKFKKMFYKVIDFFELIIDCLTNFLLS